MKAKFRFQDLRIWREAIELGLIFLEISNRLETQKLFRFADQLRGVAMSISNNIAESTGTDMVGEQQQLLRYARRECFEGANILILLNRKDLVSNIEIDHLLPRLDVLSRKITTYSKTLE